MTVQDQDPHRWGTRDAILAMYYHLDRSSADILALTEKLRAMWREEDRRWAEVAAAIAAALRDRSPT